MVEKRRKSKVISSLDGKSGYSVAKGRGKRYSRKASKKELKQKGQAVNAVVFGGVNPKFGQVRGKFRGKKAKFVTGGGF